IAASIPAVGFVTVSLRRSMGVMGKPGMATTRHEETQYGKSSDLPYCASSGLDVASAPVSRLLVRRDGLRLRALRLLRLPVLDEPPVADLPEEHGPVLDVREGDPGDRVAREGPLAE